MTNTIEMNFLQELASKSPKTRLAYDQCLRQWNGESPPVTVAFAAVGDAIAENFFATPVQILSEMFSMLEEGIASSNIALRTAIATGLVESLVTGADEREMLWDELKKVFGPVALQHAVAWRAFGKK